MTPDELKMKLRACLRFGLGASEKDAERLAATIAGLEELEDVGRAVVDAFPDKDCRG
jgi:hypothetical protein